MAIGSVGGCVRCGVMTDGFLCEDCVDGDERRQYQQLLRDVAELEKRVRLLEEQSNGSR